MDCSSCKCMWVQVGAIIAVGAAIGVADAFVLRPISLSREAPPELPGSLGGAPAGQTNGQAGSQTSTAPKASDPVQPAPTPSATNSPTPAVNPATPAVAGGAAFVFTAKDNMPAGHITVDEAKGLYDQGATFIDTRKSDVYQAGHVANAFRIELASFSGGDPPMLAMIPRDAFIVAYCTGGHCDESEAVARMLDGSGYKKVYVMHDGFPGWQAKGFPVETGKGMDQ